MFLFSHWLLQYFFLRQFTMIFSAYVTLIATALGGHMRAILSISILVFFLSPLLHARTGDLSLTAGNAKSFVVTCSTSATPIRATSTASYTSARCTNKESTVIYLGGTDVSSGNGYRLCRANTCDDDSIGVDVNLFYCLVASGTAEIRCLGLSG